VAKEKPSRAVVIDLGRCLSCRSCETACAKAHAGFEDIVEAVRSGARLVPRVRVIAAAGKGVPIQCQHCEDAPCVTVCPSGALYRDEAKGIVATAPEKCIGCKGCVVVCPFGALTWDAPTGSVIKCDLCRELIQEGQEPHCVAACPTRARRVVALTALSADRRRQAAERTVAQFAAAAEKPANDQA